jgi:hypothetical protein
MSKLRGYFIFAFSILKIRSDFLCACHVAVRKSQCSQVPVADACNPSYPGGRDQEDHGSKPAQANSSERPYLKNTLQDQELEKKFVGEELT